VQPVVAKHPGHLLGVLDAQRLEHETFGRDEPGRFSVRRQVVSAPCGEGACTEVWRCSLVIALPFSGPRLRGWPVVRARPPGQFEMLAMTKLAAACEEVVEHPGRRPCSSPPMLILGWVYPA
jgi:hypothetical protein